MSIFAEKMSRQCLICIDSTLKGFITINLRILIDWNTESDCILALVILNNPFDMIFIIMHIHRHSAGKLHYSNNSFNYYLHNYQMSCTIMLLSFNAQKTLVQLYA